MTVYKKKKIIRGKEESGGEEWEETSSSPKLFCICLWDVPASPLFKNEAEKNIIPQVFIIILLLFYYFGCYFCLLLFSIFCIFF